MDASKICWRVKKVFIHFGPVQNKWTLFWRLENTVRVNKTGQLHQRVRWNISSMVSRERKQTKRAVFHSFYSYALLPLNIVILDASKTNKHIFEASKMYENILDSSNLLLKRHLHFRHVVEICYYISMLFLTRCAHFQHFQNDIEL